MNRLEYRAGITAIIINNKEEILAGYKILFKGWELPQGGLDDNETTIDCCYREIWEEFGISKDKLELIAFTKGFIKYDIPENKKGTEWFQGQMKKWYLLKFIGTENDINLNAFETPEFSELKWVKPVEMLDTVVDFKRESYRSAFDELGIYIGS
ncbi:MAG: RNA pyrophosphohydrolase [Bacteroidales bacterium]|jgi:putative (di)nucleoside polyphosphate hydrolase|nr:RNA pyrophosphohydrolase [Bacteroidales bacterium]